MRVLLAAITVALTFVVAAPSMSATPTKVAFIGCSNTRMAVEGYHAIGGTKLWTPKGKMYNGGTILRWSLTSMYWQQFNIVDQEQPGADAVWMQVCSFPTETQNASIAAAVKVILDLHDKKPGIPVYVSSLNGFSDHECKLTGAEGPAKGAAVRDWLVSHGVALRGPDIPSLTTAQLQGDGCHPNEAGAEVLGQALMDFFG